MPPAVVWGIGVGLVIAAIDTVSLVLIGSFRNGEWPIADIDFLANIALYSFIGFRVGKLTGIVRDAAEAGVLAGVLVGIVGIGATMLLRPQVGSIESVNDVVGVMAQNVAMGGVLAIISGWFGSRAREQGPASRT